MYIRRKVFSVIKDENGEEKYFSTTEFVDEETYLSQKEFGVVDGLKKIGSKFSKQLERKKTDFGILKKIKSGEPLSDKEIKRLASKSAITGKKIDKFSDKLPGKLKDVYKNAADEMKFISDEVKSRYRNGQSVFM